MKMIKEAFLNFYSKKKRIYWTIAIMVLLLVGIIGLIVSSKLLKRYSYLQIETMMVESAKKYVGAHKEVLPTSENPAYEVLASALVNENLMKDFTKLSKDTNCDGYVNVTYNQDLYRYTPILVCDHYETKTLKDKILENEEIVDNKDGLYKIDDVYRFKGDYVNNYMTFAKKTWRIFKNEDNKFYLVLADTINTKNSAYVFDDRYNIDSDNSRGNNDYDTSRIRDVLNQIYSNDFEGYKSYIVEHNACKHSRGENDNDFTGIVECHTTTNVMISLMAVYDYLGASRDVLCLNTDSQNCVNYNYLASTKNNWWLLNGTNENSYKVYYVNSSGKLNLDNANSKKYLRYVITIPDDVLYKSGNGTNDNPYTIYQY